MCEYLDLIERTLDEVMLAPSQRPCVLSEAMRYAVGTGGKRLRPLVCLFAAASVGGKVEDALYPAAAVELVHNYTLIHDDLPAMDNDELRRGKPTVWKRFGQANAILAGDALLSLSFAVAAKAPRNVDRIIRVLAERSVGVVAGQVEDLAPQDLSSRDVDFIYEHKTADLFVAAAVMGALAAGAEVASLAALERFAVNLGLAFQHEDDLLDGEATDSREKVEGLVRAKTAAAIAALEGLPGETSMLAELARKLVSRRV